MGNKFSALQTQIFSTQALNEIQEALHELHEESKDLGFGPDITQHVNQRLLNKDGSFNVRREGYNLFRSRSIYHALLNSKWQHFFAIIFCAYIVINFFFAALFFALGPEALAGSDATGLALFFDCFFFSVQTFSTVGSQKLHPISLTANFLVTLQSLVGLLGFALATGLLFTRFSRPSSKVIFSKFALIAPQQDGLAFEFRAVNARPNMLLHLEARVVMSRLERQGGCVRRKFYDLELERRQIMFFPLHWTIVHPIDQDSPLCGATREELAQSDAEFLVMLSGMDDTFWQTVYTWTSYKHNEIVWGGAFDNILETCPDGSVKINLDRVHEFHRVEIAPALKAANSS